MNTRPFLPVHPVISGLFFIFGRASRFWICWIDKTRNGEKGQREKAKSSGIPRKDTEREGDNWHTNVENVVVNDEEREWKE